MDHERELLRAFEEAGKLIRECRLLLVNVNEFAWHKLRRIDAYLSSQQEVLGKRFFKGAG